MYAFIVITDFFSGRNFSNSFACSARYFRMPCLQLFATSSSSKRILGSTAEYNATSFGAFLSYLATKSHFGSRKLASTWYRQFPSAGFGISIKFPTNKPTCYETPRRVPWTTGYIRLSIDFATLTDPLVCPFFSPLQHENICVQHKPLLHPSQEILVIASQKAQVTSAFEDSNFRDDLPGGAVSSGNACIPSTRENDVPCFSTHPIEIQRDKTYDRQQRWLASQLCSGQAEQSCRTPDRSPNTLEYSG